MPPGCDIRQVERDAQPGIKDRERPRARGFFVRSTFFPGDRRSISSYSVTRIRLLFFPGLPGMANREILLARQPLATTRIFNRYIIRYVDTRTRRGREKRFWSRTSLERGFTTSNRTKIARTDICQPFPTSVSRDGRLPVVLQPIECPLPAKKTCPTKFLFDRTHTFALA